MEFQWCQIQYGRVTYVNGVWQGEGDVNPDRYHTCPNVWEYLNKQGGDGWDVASSHGYEIVVGDAQDALQVVVLRRAKKP